MFESYKLLYILNRTNESMWYIIIYSQNKNSLINLIFNSGVYSIVWLVVHTYSANSFASIRFYQESQLHEFSISKKLGNKRNSLLIIKNFFGGELIIMECNYLHVWSSHKRFNFIYLNQHWLNGCTKWLANREYTHNKTKPLDSLPYTICWIN